MMSGGRHRARAVRPLIALALVLMAAVFGLQTLVESAPKAHAGSYTPAGNWWGVDSVSPINAADLAAVRNWYQGGTPQVWGRYISDIGGALTTTEMNYASQNGIYLYLLVADRNNSSPLVCGRDLNPADAVADAQTAIAAASALHVNAGAVIFKDFEQNAVPQRAIRRLHRIVVPNRGGIELRRRLLRQLLQPDQHLLHILLRGGRLSSWHGCACHAQRVRTRA